MKILFIVNPVAGKGKAKSLVPSIEKACDKNGIEYELKYTTKPKDGIELARWGTENGFSKIVSVGGDGTLNEVLNGMAGSDAVLGVIPGGTGNDFIRSINDHSVMHDFIDDVLFGDIRTIDLAKCDDRFFINIGSGGFDSEVAREVESAKRFFSGSTAYVVTLLKMIFTYKGKKMRVIIDDYEFEKNTLLVAVANGRYYGGGIMPAPKADIADGVFDICYVENLPKISMLLLFPKYMKGKHEKIKWVTFYRGRKVRLISDEEFAINLDGEILMKKEVEFSIIPSGIRIMSNRR